MYTDLFRLSLSSMSVTAIPANPYFLPKMTDSALGLLFGQGAEWKIQTENHHRVEKYYQKIAYVGEEKFALR